MPIRARLTSCVPAAVLVAVAVLLATGCGSPDAGTSPAPAPMTTLRGAAAIRGVDPCALLTRSEVARVVGGPVGRPARRTNASIPVCTWRAKAAAKQQVTATVQVAPAWVFTQTRRQPGRNAILPASARTRMRTLPGIGDAAYAISLNQQKTGLGYGGDLVAVRVGDRSAFVSADARLMGSLGSVAQAMDLAKLVAPRLCRGATCG